MRRASGSSVALSASLSLLVALAAACSSSEDRRDDGGVVAAVDLAGADQAGLDLNGGEPDLAVPMSTSCEPLPPPTGTQIMVTAAEANMLPSIVAGAAAGATILLADGVYASSASGESARRIQITKAGITLRSASGNRDAVVIDGGYMTDELITISASNVTVGDLTVRRGTNHLVHVTGGATDVTGVRLHNLVLLDSGEQFVKVNSNGTSFVDDGVLDCSRLELTAAGRPQVESLGGTSCYTGGIDAHQARGWRVQLNHFEGIYCTTGFLAEHAVHFWTGSRDTLVERNTIIDCARGIGFGLGENGNGTARVYADDPYPQVAGYIGHYDGIIRNNVLYAAIAQFDTGIELEQAHGTRVFHNTLVHPMTAFASIGYRFANTLVDVRNNIYRKISARDGATGTVSSNLETSSTAIFIDAAAHDLHLSAGATEAIDKGVVLAESGLDLDGAPHSVGAPDIGADERGAP